MATHAEDAEWAVGCEQWAVGGKTHTQALNKAKELDAKAACGSLHYAWKAPNGPTYNTGRHEVNIPADAERP